MQKLLLKMMGYKNVIFQNVLIPKLLTLEESSTYIDVYISKYKIENCIYLLPEKFHGTLMVGNDNIILLI